MLVCVHKQLAQSAFRLIDLGKNRLLESSTDAEVRRSMMQFLALTTVLVIVMVMMQWLRVPSEIRPDASSSAPPRPLGIAVEFSWIAMYLSVAAIVLLLKPGKVVCTRLSVAIVLAEGIVAMVRYFIYHDPSPGGNAVFGVLIGLTLGASILPWSPKQVLLMSGVWIVGSVSSVLLVNSESVDSVPASVFIYVLITIPGAMISFFRSTRFQDQFELRFIKSEFEQVREELLAAKSIHERAFPEPRMTGSLRFQYIYKPMSQIGGDYLFASVRDDLDPESPVTLVLFDVTGHGIAAALTANRLQGELARILGEHPDVLPADLLTMLNRYVCLTLSNAAVLVTAMALRADPSENTLTVANAGHPAGILRLGSGELKHVVASVPPLGVDSTSDFSPRDHVYPFEPGDSMVAYTDGVTEAKDKSGEMFGLEGIESVLASGWVDGSSRWPENILNGVTQHRAGTATDDILIVDLYRLGV
jgi:uncharacterized membrane protein YidH (DUF202 family)